MYKSYKADWYKERYSLPEDYNIQGLLSYGAWNTQKYFSKLNSILDDLGIKHNGRQLDGFLRNIYELEIGVNTTGLLLFMVEQCYLNMFTWLVFLVQIKIYILEVVAVCIQKCGLWISLYQTGVLVMIV
jgi:hypothetical protein